MNIAPDRGVYRKPHSGGDFEFNGENSLFLKQNSLFRRNNSLFCYVGICSKALEIIGRMGCSKPLSGPKLKYSLFFSLLAGNLVVETGSIATAPATKFAIFCRVRKRMFAFNSRVSLANHWPRRGVL
jgi:hypothetical protein